MFIYSVRASTIKFFGIMLLGVAALIVTITLIPASDAGVAAAAQASDISYGNAGTNDGRISFLAQFGWETESAPCEEKQVAIPKDFAGVFAGYNDIQKAQGLDLSPYAGQELTRCTYVVTNYPGYDGLVYANLLISRDTVVGGDISSADVAGFVHGFAKE